MAKSRSIPRRGRKADYRTWKKIAGELVSRRMTQAEWNERRKAGVSLLPVVDVEKRVRAEIAHRHGVSEKSVRRILNLCNEIWPSKALGDKPLLDSRGTPLPEEARRAIITH